MNLTDSLSDLKTEVTQKLAPQIRDLLAAALAEGQLIHEIEYGVWNLARQLVRQALGVFLDGHGRAASAVCQGT